MDFSQRKLPTDSKSQLHPIRVGELRPYTLLFSPVYIWLKKNEKFVSIRAPLDFLSEVELAKFNSAEYFYLRGDSFAMAPFLDAGRIVRELFTQRSAIQLEGTSPVYITYAPYELSNEVLKSIGRLWWRESSNGGLRIEPFLVAVFVNELCGDFPAEAIVRARDLGSSVFEGGVLVSSWVVFVALLLGYCNLDILRTLRLKTLEFWTQVDARSFKSLKSMTNQSAWSDFVKSVGIDLAEVVNLAIETIQVSGATEIQDAQGRFQTLVRVVLEASLGDFESAVGLKLQSRLVRIKSGLAAEGIKAPTVYGKEGFLVA